MSKYKCPIPNLACEDGCPLWLEENEECLGRLALLMFVTAREGDIPEGASGQAQDPAVLKLDQGDVAI